MDLRMGRLLAPLYQLCYWITHFAYLNLLWVMFIFLGGIVFGIFPSTVALFTIARKHTLGEHDIPIFRTFVKTFRQEFFRVNVLGWLVVLLGVIWYMDLHFFRQFSGPIFMVLNFMMIVLGLVYIMLNLFLFPVYVHYDLKLWQYIKQALLIAFLRPSSLALLFFGTLGAYYFYITIPALIPLFGISLLVYFQMRVAYNGFQKIHQRAQMIASIHKS